MKTFAYKWKLSYSKGNSYLHEVVELCKHSKHELQQTYISPKSREIRCITTKGH